MITRDPDITRLLDRLHQQGLVSRERSQQDRRVVKASITAEGLQVLEALDPVLASSRANLSEGFSEKELTNLVQYLERVRRNVAG
jgi:DNA-binding MarR family transcriptional regulator